MSTTEYPIKDYGDGTAGTYLSKCATCGTVFIGHKRDVWCGCTRPAASVEAGQPSALRASAPEGTDVLAAERDALRSALARLVFVINAAGLQNLTNGVQLGQTSWYIKASDAMAEAGAALALPVTPPQAVKPAIPSPAPQAPPPEGQDDPRRLVKRNIELGYALDLLRHVLSEVTSAAHAGYDWNADPKALTKLCGDAFALYDEVTTPGRHRAPSTPEGTDDRAALARKIIGEIEHSSRMGGIWDLASVVRETLKMAEAAGFRRQGEAEEIRALVARERAEREAKCAAIARAEAAEKDSNHQCRERAKEVERRIAVERDLDYYRFLHGNQAKTIVETQAKVAAAQAEAGHHRMLAKGFENVIRWALGEIGEFPSRPEGRGPYHWRDELRKRADAVSLAALSSPGQSQGRGSGEDDHV